MTNTLTKEKYSKFFTRSGWLTRGATFPASHGVKAIPIIRAVVNSGATWHRNGKTIHLGHYQIDSINPAQGIIKAGCHTVPLAEVERIANVLGV